MGDVLATIFANDMEKAKEAYAKIVCAYEVQQEEPNPVPMIKGILK